MWGNSFAPVIEILYCCSAKDLSYLHFHFLLPIIGAYCDGPASLEESILKMNAHDFSFVSVENNLMTYEVRLCVLSIVGVR